VEDQLGLALGVLLDLVGDALSRDHGALQLGLLGLELGHLLPGGVALALQVLQILQQLADVGRHTFEEVAHVAALVAARTPRELHVLELERAQPHLPTDLSHETDVTALAAPRGSDALTTRPYAAPSPPLLRRWRARGRRVSPCPLWRRGRAPSCRAAWRAAPR